MTTSLRRASAASGSRCAYTSSFSSKAERSLRPTNLSMAASRSRGLLVNSWLASVRPLALGFLAFRVLFCAAYIADRWILRSSTWFGGSPSSTGPRLEKLEIVSVVHVVAPTVNASGYRASGW